MDGGFTRAEKHKLYKLSLIFNGMGKKLVKLIGKVALPIALATLLSGCAESYLNRQPKWKTEDYHNHINKVIPEHMRDTIMNPYRPAQRGYSLI